jgi:hypothetical protein
MASALFDAGLTTAEASARLARDGYNELPTAKRLPVLNPQL